MPYVVIEDFRLGLDRRRDRTAGTPGSLWNLVNAHLTRGGEIERRKKFVPKYTLPDGTFGMLAVAGALYVFGSGADPGVPAGVTYQRLRHPDLTTAMTRVVYAAGQDGRPYVIAEFANGDIFHFYDGALVADWLNGIVRADMTNNSGIAAHLAALIDADSELSAEAAGAVITVTGPVGKTVTITTLAENGGAIDDQTLTVATTQTALEFDDAALIDAGAGTPIGTMTGNGGLAASFDGQTVETGANCSTMENVAQTAAARNVGKDWGSGNDRIVAKVICYGASDQAGFCSSSLPTTLTLQGSADGAAWVTLGTTVVDAPAAGAVATVTSTDLATAYRYHRVGNHQAGAGTGHRSLFAELEFSEVVPGRPQISTITVGGTFDPGDRFSVIVETDENGERSFGASGNPETVGKTLLVYKSKIYSAVGPLVHFSGVNTAVVWNRDNTEFPGAGFINAAAQDEGAEDIRAVQVYQGTVAFFARDSVQIWQLDVDPELNTFLQPLKNTGTRSPKSAVSYGAIDTFYLADSGIRSLRPRDSSSQAYMNDVGVAIDVLVQEFLATLAEADIERAVATLQPYDDRYWLAVGGRIFVLSYFPGSKVSAWSYYDVADDIGAAIDDFARIGSQLFARSGDIVYLYGGDTGAVYPGDDEIVAAVELPFLDAKTPATAKNWAGFDMFGSGTWRVWALPDPNRPEVEIEIGSFAKHTASWGRVTFHHTAPAVALKLECSAAGPATLSRLIAHYRGPHEAG